MGALSKAIATTATYPFQVVKSRLQQRQGVYTGVVDCVTKTLRSVPSHMLALPRLRVLVSHCAHCRRNNFVSQRLCFMNYRYRCCTIVPVCSNPTVCVMPLFDCVILYRVCNRYEGVLGFFKGVFVNLYKVVPTSAITLVVYEHVRSVLIQF